MTGFVAIGAVVGTWMGGAVGGAIAASAIASAVVGVVASAVVGAVIGGLVSAVSGGDIGKGMLFGAIGGLTVGAAFGTGIAGAMGGGTEVSSAAATGGAYSSTSSASAASQLAAAESAAGIITSTESTESTEITAGEELAFAALGEGGKMLYEGQQAGEAADLAKEEADKNRAFLTMQQDKDLANALERAKIASAGLEPEFWLAEKQALKKSDIDQAIRQYQAKVDTDVGASSESYAGIAEGINKLDLPARGKFTGDPEGVLSISKIGSQA